MSLPEAVQTVLTKKYADFSGRARRSELWWWWLAAAIALIATDVICLAIHNYILYIVVALAQFLPSLAVAVRRLHDTDRSGWWILIGFIPIIGAIVLLVFYVQEGTLGDNKYGPSPKGGPVAYPETNPGTNWG